MPTGEVSTHEIVLQALNQGKTVFVPYIYRSQDNNSQKPTTMMEMLALHSTEDLESLKPDAWGIPTLDASSVGGRENALSGYGLQNVETGADVAPARSYAPSLDLM